jgi:hypothetical protein
VALMIAINPQEIEQQVLTAMAKVGISPVDGKGLVIDGKIHKYQVKETSPEKKTVGT